jgi:LPXTG-motif cell wall-anchored protein
LRDEFANSITDMQKLFLFPCPGAVMKKFFLVSVKRNLNGRMYLRQHKRMIQVAFFAMLFVVLNLVIGMNGCDCNDSNNSNAPSVTNGTPPVSQTQGFPFNSNDLFNNQLYNATGAFYKRGAMDAGALHANAATTTVTLPSLLLSFPPPLYGLAQTVNYAQTNASSGVYVTSSTPAPTAAPEVLGVQRQSDCSFSLVGMSTTETSFPTSLPFTATGTATYNADFGTYLHAVSGLPAQTVQFPLGCKGAQLGIASQSLVFVGPDSKGDQVFVGLVPILGYAVVLLNPGSGTLSATPLPQAVSLGLASLTFNVADVNGDGINDLIAIEGYSTTQSVDGVYVFLGHADGTFANPVQYAAGPNPEAAVIDDVNGDGKLDLIVDDGQFGPNNIFTLLGNGDGTFKPAIIAGGSSDLNVANYTALATGDFNGDGKKDLVLSDGEILLGNGNGTFAASAFTLPINLPAGNGGIPVVGDFNHDGKLDVALNIPIINGNPANSGEVMVFLGNGDGTFTAGASYVNIPGSGHMATEDVDGDGNLDLILGSGDNGVYSADTYTNGVFQFLMGRGDGTFAGAPSYQNVAYGGLNPVAPTFAVGDFNGDGKPDILTDMMSNNNIQGMVLLAGDGQGNFTQGATIKGDYPLALVAADMNGDKKLDAVYIGYLSGTYTLDIALGNGDGTFQTATDVPLPSGKFNDFVVGDFNGDGKPDVMITMTSFSTNAGAIYLFLGNGDGTLQSPVSIDTPPQAWGLAAGDFNGDGKLDFAVTNNGSSNTTGAVLVYLNQGSGAFAKPVSYAASMFPGPIVVADVNKDGKPDLVVASEDNATITSSNPFGPHGTLNVLLGNGDGTFQTALSSPLNGPMYSNLAVADMNQDGIPDVVVGDDGPPFFYTQVLYGKGDGTFPTGNSLQMGLAAQSVTAVDVNGDGRPDLLLTTGTSYASLDVFVNQYSGKTISTLPATTTALSVTPNPAVAGQTVTFTAQVTAASGSTVPTGTVNFMNGTTQLGTGTLNSSGQATYTTTSLAVGSYPVTAVYSGDTNFSGSTSPAVTLVVNAQPVAASTTTTLVTSAATANAGQNVTFTATVAGPSGSTGEPTGTVTFLDGTSTLGTGTLNASGVATYSTSSLSVGTHSITAQYSGDTNFAPSVSSAITETILAAPTFTLATKTTSLSITPGQSGTTTLSVTPVNGFNQAVSFACSGLPSEAACSFSPATVTPSGTTASSTTMTITTTAASSSRNSNPWPFAGGGLTLALGLLFFRRRKRLPALLCLTLLLGIGGMAIGCGGGSASKPPSNLGTPAGTSTVTVTASSGTGTSAITQSATLTLTVQ